jgi:branched-chain amino acid transport system ATP-binding protein
VLRVEDVSVAFGGVRAVRGASFAADAGRVTGLIGPNGAGKTTLFDVVTGLQKPTAGKVWLDGRDITRLGPRQRARLGIARTFQRLEVFGSLTVRENVMVALEARGRWLSGGPRHERVDALLARVGLSTEANTLGDDLSTGMARRLEVARALATEPRVLLLDETSSGLDRRESTGLGHLMTDLADEGIAVLLVEHDMDLVMWVCEQIYVLDFGEIIATGTPDAISENPTVRAAYLGAQAGGVAQHLPTERTVT